ncbi:Putative purine-cytosine permease [Septoria linicola]|uniref:Purine-cytosine permease n=1 Tax=Septoria linicola TaxID=215465 RepID=A0A9Q9EIP8_9PEZI|nr:putative purine-cytosine permease [Septoria linicola]USW51272.1 Putative purine-cytosine permease [Septoria linicola]
MSSSTDIEKHDAKLPVVDDQTIASDEALSINEGHVYDTKMSWWKRHWHTIRSDFTETRGIDRVPPDQRQPGNFSAYVQMISLWLSANLTANHVALGLLGPSIYGLSFLDSALCATFGVMVGCACTGYMSTFGPQSGNRTMIIARYSMGWWPSRICVVLNLVIMLGYGMIDCVVGGQMLSAIAGGNVSVIVGVIIVAVITWSVTVIGLPVLEKYERYGWIPQACVLLILAGCAGPYFDVSASSVGTTKTIVGNRLSIFALCLSAPSAWAPAGADFYVYFDQRTSKKLTFFLTWLGETLGYVICLYLGIGLATGLEGRADWTDADDVGPGAVLVAGFNGLGAFGHFCACIMMLGVIANNVLGTYACGLGFQCLGSWPLKVPRMVWNTFSVVVYTICAAVGRNCLYDIFQNFLSLMGYWVAIWIVITLQDQLIFRRRSGYTWEDWNDSARLPVGLAALATFIIGWAGAVLGMNQVYFMGPVASLIGDDGTDIGLFIGSSWAALVYPPLRALEKKAIGR